MHVITPGRLFRKLKAVLMSAICQVLSTLNNTVFRIAYELNYFCIIHDTATIQHS